MTNPMKQQHTNGFDDQFLSVLKEPFPSDKKAELKASLFDAPAKKPWQKLFEFLPLNFNPNRSSTMRNNIRRPLMGLLTAMTLFALLFAFSPEVRAAVARLTVLAPFVDGVTINSEQPNELSIFQKSGSTILNEDHFHYDELEPVSDAELAEDYENFILPTNMPEGYTFEPPVQRIEGANVLVATWVNDAGDEIVYNYWGHSDFYNANGEDVTWFETDEGSINTANYGVEASLTTTDASLTKADLEAMMP